MFEGSPFSVLGVSVFDTKQRIIEVADFHEGAVSHDELLHAKSALINPRVRIAVEVAWLPGVTPERASTLTSSPPLTIGKAKALHSISTLAYANVVCAVLDSGQATLDTVDEYVEWLILLALLVEAIDVEETTELINKDREVSGFPKIRDGKLISDALSELNAKHATTVMNIVGSLPSEMMHQIFYEVTSRTTTSGAVFAPQFIDLLVDRYEVMIANDLHVFNTWIDEQIDEVKSNLEAKRLALAGHQVDILIERLKWWGSLVRPLQITAKSKHSKHKDSESMASRCRSLSIAMCNDLDAAVYSHLLISELLEIFVDAPERHNKFTEDSVALEDILKGRKAKRSVDRNWDESYFGEDQSTNYLSINEEALETNLALIEVRDVTGIRWWRRQDSFSRSYHIGVSSNDQSILISPTDGESYEDISDCLWQRFALPISLNIIDSLHSNLRMRFGCIEVSDFGIYFPAYKNAPSQQKMLVPWNKLSALDVMEDSLVLTDKDEIYFACIEFSVTNILVLRALIALVIEVGASKLSDFAVSKSVDASMSQLSIS